MNEKKIPEEFDNMPIIGPNVKAFIDLLSKIAARPYNQDSDENRIENNLQGLKKDNEKKI